MLNTKKLFVNLCSYGLFLALFSCDETDTQPLCEGKPNIQVAFSGKRKTFVDPSSKAHHVFYYLNATNKSSQSCTPDSKQCFIQQQVLYSESEDFSTNVVVVDESFITVPTLTADQMIEVESKVDFYKSGYYKIQWEADKQNAVDESDETDNIFAVNKFHVLIE
jgi:hypothetical protein